jgi:hypothetical protein
MAHDEHVKARAMALLMTGDPPRHVAKAMGIPRTTIRRWQKEAFAFLRAELPDLCHELHEVGRAVAGVFPGLLQQNGPKKTKAE